MCYISIIRVRHVGTSNKTLRFINRVNSIKKYLTTHKGKLNVTDMSHLILRV